MLSFLRIIFSLEDREMDGSIYRERNTHATTRFTYLQICWQTDKCLVKKLLLCNSIHSTILTILVLVHKSHTVISTQSKTRPFLNLWFYSSRIYTVDLFFSLENRHSSACCYAIITACMHDEGMTAGNTCKSYVIIKRHLGSSKNSFKNWVCLWLITSAPGVLGF